VGMNDLSRDLIYVCTFLQGLFLQDSFCVYTLAWFVPIILSPLGHTHSHPFPRRRTPLEINQSCTYQTVLPNVEWIQAVYLGRLGLSRTRCARLVFHFLRWLWHVGNKREVQHHKSMTPERHKVHSRKAMYVMLQCTITILGLHAGFLHL